MQQILINTTVGPTSIAESAGVDTLVESPPITITADVVKVRIRGCGGNWSAADESFSLALANAALSATLLDTGGNYITSIYLSSSQPTSSPDKDEGSVVAQITDCLELTPQAWQGGTIVGSIRITAAGYIQNSDAGAAHSVTALLTGLVEVLTLSDLED